MWSLATLSLPGYLIALFCALTRDSLSTQHRHHSPNSNKMNISPDNLPAKENTAVKIVDVHIPLQRCTDI